MSFRRLTTLTVGLSLACSLARAGEVKLETDEQKTLYALGMALARNLATFSLSADELALVQAGLADSILQRDTKGIDLAAYQAQIQQLAQARSEKMAAGEMKESEKFLTTAAAAKGAQKTASGLIYNEIKAGSGKAPTATDKVSVHYHGTLRDGTVFDSSVQRGEPATFGLNQVIPCWTEGLQKMKVGGKAKLVCPAEIAYGDRGAGGLIKPGAALVFEVELLSIVAE